MVDAVKQWTRFWSQRAKWLPTPLQFKTHAIWLPTTDRAEIAVALDMKIEKRPAAEIDAVLATVSDTGFHWMLRLHGIWNHDGLVEDLDLPTFEKIRELNDDDLYEQATAAATAAGVPIEENGDTTEAFFEILHRFEADLYDTWRHAIDEAIDSATDDPFGVTFMPMAWSGTSDARIIAANAPYVRLAEAGTTWTGAASAIFDLLEPDGSHARSTRAWKSVGATTARQYVCAQIIEAIKVEANGELRMRYNRAWR